MKYLVLFLLLYIFSDLSHIEPKNIVSVDCIISDGIYTTVYDEEFENEPFFMFQIDNDSLFNKYGFYHSSKIERLPNNSFIVTNTDVKTDSLSPLKNYRTDYFKYKYYEIVKCNEDTLWFKNGENRNKIKLTGFFVKMK